MDQDIIIPVEEYNNLLKENEILRQAISELRTTIAVNHEGTAHDANIGRLIRELLYELKPMI